ncbi:MAG: class I SAM-dependent methyltransferase, partial [Sphaerochaetaceae bacterium]|nr:class I SAM-dependent methyltransferase [Sphaerochaetaceae bacterium]
NSIVTTVKENGLSFKVDLTTYVDTGLFLDQALTRALIRERSANADVLNLFSYTGSFSVYAASGMANSVTSVDMSNTYTNWALENLSLNGYSGDMYKCVCMDAAKFIKEAKQDGLKYDIIIFDPPSFSNSHKMEHDFDVARDYVVWVRNLFSILKKTGIILFSTNLGTFKMDKRMLKGVSIKEITGAVVAPGFVRDRKGTVRSWMMAFDEDSLSLDWSEPEKKSEKGSDRERSRERRYDRPREGRRDYYSRDNRERRERSDRPERRERSYSREERPRRDFDRSDRPERSDRPRYNREDRPYRTERTDRSDRPERPRYNRDREDRPYRADRPERSSYERRDRFNREDRPERSERGERRYSREDRPERPRYERSDRPERSERTERDYPRRERTSSKKPFGYDSFKPARSREDSTDFFWNSEDLK